MTKHNFGLLFSSSFSFLILLHYLHSSLSVLPFVQFDAIFLSLSLFSTTSLNYARSLHSIGAAIPPKTPSGATKASLLPWGGHSIDLLGVWSHEGPKWRHHQWRPWQEVRDDRRPHGKSSHDANFCEIPFSRLPPGKWNGRESWITWPFFPFRVRSESKIPPLPANCARSDRGIWSRAPRKKSAR